MTGIQELLEDLNLREGVFGSAVATADGILVASALRDRFHDDVVTGLASFLVWTTRRALGQDDVRIERFVMHATHGKLVIVDIGDAFLVVISDQFAPMDPLLVDIDESSRLLRRLVRVEG
jgi:predicted regulator of Ras-like GTPase activity (Roadblock/LC7/MglB family)